MVATARAGISVLMLLGFYLVALLQLAGAAALTFWLTTRLPGAIAVKLTFPLFAATVGAVGVAIWRAFRARPEPPEGLPVDPDRAPDLWETVHRLAGKVGTRMPDEIRLVPEINAAVVEQSRLLGLLAGRRVLYIGLPLLQVFSVDQLHAVLAHELGHYSRRHTQLAAVAYRGRLTIAETLSRIGPHNVAGWVFKAYARLYVLVDNAVVRRQEYEADEASVLVAGRAAAASALRELPVLEAAWAFYFATYVKPGWEAGYAPDDMFGGYAKLVEARAAELDRLRAEEPPDKASTWDTHPPIADRVAAILAMPESTVYHDGRPAWALVPNLGELGWRLQELMVNIGARAVLPWPQFTHAWLTAQTQREADQAFRAVARQTGAPELNLGSVFNLIASGRLDEVAARMFPTAGLGEAPARMTAVLEVLMQLAAVRSGVAGWQHSWSGTAQFVTVHGYPLSLEELAKLASSPGGVDEAYRRLLDLGIDITKARLVEKTASALGSGVIAALGNVKVDGVEHDLIVLNQGLVFVPNPGKADQGRRRLAEIIGRAPAAELAEAYRFLPYEEVASASVAKRVPARADVVLHGGRTVALQETWGSELITKDSRDVLLEVLGALARRGGA
ncbi:MAG TPA: M48 family metallopeptidase [Micromonosporaceae bacterium]|jgi:Zn-dependent protease with chaperone function